jgi:glycosyltransferase involved in cell wall biosynthesis
MFLIGFFPLKKILKVNQPDYLIVHLITSLPLVLLIMFSFKTKFILRISGYPRMNLLRTILWKKAFKKIYLVTCPTKNTYNYLKKLNIIDASKIKLLYDPVIDVKDINKEKNKKIDIKNYYFSAGRLTTQKNFIFLCRVFKKIIQSDENIKLIIAGKGEKEKQLRKFIDENNLSKNIILLGYVENIYSYFKNARGFILTSLWEDPGFVLVEAAYCRTPIMSSNAWPGPVELIKKDLNGIVFENNNVESFLEEFKKFSKITNHEKFTINNLKMSRKFTVFNHFKNLSKLIC